MSVAKKWERYKELRIEILVTFVCCMYKDLQCVMMAFLGAEARSYRAEALSNNINIAYQEMMEVNDELVARNKALEKEKADLEQTMKRQFAAWQAKCREVQHQGRRVQAFEWDLKSLQLKYDTKQDVFCREGVEIKRLAKVIADSRVSANARLDEERKAKVRRYGTMLNEHRSIRGHIEKYVKRIELCNRGCLRTAVTRESVPLCVDCEVIVPMALRRARWESAKAIGELENVLRTRWNYKYRVQFRKWVTRFEDDEMAEARSR